jgi:hypothetical protein
LSGNAPWDALPAFAGKFESRISNLFSRLAAGMIAFLVWPPAAGRQPVLRATRKFNHAHKS